MVHGAQATAKFLGVSVRTRPAGWVKREVLAPGSFILAALASSYAMSSLPNVKLLDLLVFVAAYTLGLRRGLVVAAGTWLVYGTINPWGPTHGALLLTLIAAETVYVFAGVLARRIVPPSRVNLRPGASWLVFLAAAVVATATYDVIANLYTGYFWAIVAGGNDYGRWLWVALTNPGALFFMAVHVGANAMLFPVFGPLLVKGAERAKGRLGW
jgi:hypothetical protein